MFSYLKNLIRQPVKEIRLNDSLVDRLTPVVYHTNLNALFFSSVNKLYLLNTYSNSFYDLLDHLLTPEFNRKLNAINVHSYFEGSRVDLSTRLARLPQLLLANKIHPLIEADLHELCSAYEYFLSLER